jgi:hypothetical protein
MAASRRVYRELAHLETHVPQCIAKLGGSLSLALFNDGQIKHHDNPHEAVSRKHRYSSLRAAASASGRPGQRQVELFPLAKKYLCHRCCQPLQANENLSGSCVGLHVIV